MSRRIIIGALVVLVGSPTARAQKLTLTDALQKANDNNGTVQAARLNYEAAKANTKAAYSAFLPTITPNVQQENGRLNTLTGPSKGGTNIDSTDASITARWLLLDNGSRKAVYRQSQLSREQVEYTSLDTYRSVLFDVHSSFYSALRSQQLLMVAQASLERALKLQDAAEKKEKFGAGPRKDILQAQADALNAKVNVLTSTNRVSTDEAALKAVLGLSTDTEIQLDDTQDAKPTMVDYTLEQAFADGLSNRPGLIAARKRAESAKIEVTLARLDGGVTWQATANYNKSFSESVFDRSTLALTASIPLFDGARSKEATRAAQLSYESQLASLTQTERDIRAEIESAYKAFRQNFNRLEAAQLAREAAKLNYEAASGAFTEGAGTVLDQLTAQVSLATAESNYVQAFYDLLISEVELKRVTGKPLPGEFKGE